MMKAVIVDSPGDRKKLGVKDVARPSVQPGEVLIKVEYAGCNWGDVQKRQGIYPDPVDYPCILGGEGSGYIVACGDGVRHLCVGQPVAFMAGTDMLGAFAEYISIPANLVIPLSAEFDLRAAAAMPIAALTAFHLLHTAYKLRRTDKILIHSISGGVGLMLTQWAHIQGATIFGTVGTAAKAGEALSLGARLVVDRSTDDFVDMILDATDGRGVDLVIDSLGADILPRSFDVLRYFGHLINIGEAAGEPDFPVRKTLYKRSTSMAGFELRHVYHDLRRWRYGVRALMRALDASQLRVVIGNEFAMHDIRAAQKYMEGRMSIGKVILKVGA